MKIWEAIEYVYIPDFSVNDLLCESGGVADDKVPLIPGRIVPEVLLQQTVHILQLLPPQAKGLQCGGCGVC